MTRAERSRKYESLVIDRLQSYGGEPAARFVGVSEATITRLKNDHLANLCDLLTALDLKIVPGSMKCYRPESIASILQLAKERMEQLESPEQLVWGE